MDSRGGGNDDPLVGCRHSVALSDCGESPQSAGMTVRWLGVVTPAKAGVHVLQTLPSDFVAPMLWILSAIICFSSAASWACPAMDKARSGTQNDGLPHELRSLFSGGPGLDHGQFAPIGTPLCHRGFR